MARTTTHREKLECRRATNFIFAQFRNDFARVGKAAGVSEKTAKKWFLKGAISQIHVADLLDTPEVNNQLRKHQVRPDITSWEPKRK